MRIGFFVDVTNLYYCCGKKFGGRKIDYRKLWDHVSKWGDIYRAIAYGSQQDTEASGFIACLQNIGYETRFKIPHSTNLSVELAMDVVRCAHRVDLLVIGSTNVAPLVDWVRNDAGAKCIVLGCGISRDLRAVPHMEIGELLLE